MNKTINHIRCWIAGHATVRILLAALLTVLCLFELRAIVIELRDTYRSGEVYLSSQNGHSMLAPETMKASDIESWMTFSYINFVFKLPSNYLATTLHLSDPHYPNIQISRYARMNHLDVGQILASVRQAVTNYTP